MTGWDGELGESDSLKEQVGMDSLQAVEFRRIICSQVSVIQEERVKKSVREPASRPRSYFSLSVVILFFQSLGANLSHFRT